MPKLTDQQKQAYQADIQIDENKDFNDEWHRTTALEMSLIDQYGFEGVEIIFDMKDGTHYYQLGRFPITCPWAQTNQDSIQDAIAKIFAPLADHLPQLIQTLQERCRFIFATEHEREWQLHYLLDMKFENGRSYYTVYTGGAPNANPQANQCLTRYQWSIPPELKAFYAVHDGFTAEYSIGVQGSDGIWILSEIMDEIAQRQNFQPENYRFQDLLEFYPDGLGNGQCFFRQNGRLTTVDWDHETREISNQSDFFPFIDDALSDIDEE